CVPFLHSSPFAEEYPLPSCAPPHSALSSAPVLPYLAIQMPTLLEKMEANAAMRLPLPPGAVAAQELPRYKNFLKVESHRLMILHRAGAGGREICQGRAALIDLL